MATKSVTKTMGKTTAKAEPTAVNAESVAAKEVPVATKDAKPTSAVKAEPKKAAPAKKAPAKRSTVKKEIKVKTFVEFYGKQVEESAILAAVKKAWTKSGKKVGDIKTVELYIKPEEETVYYVINGTEGGGIPF